MGMIGITPVAVGQSSISQAANVNGYSRVPEHDCVNTGKVPNASMIAIVDNED